MALFRTDADDGTLAGRSAPAAPVNPAEQHNLIGRSTVLQGTLRSGGNVNISGTVEGNVEAEGRTMVMAGGLVEGEVASTSAEIGGTVKGRVTVRERLVLKATAVIDGDIRTGTLVVEDGAQFNGTCEMGAVVASRTQHPAEAPSTPLRPETRPAADVSGRPAANA